MNMKQMGFTFLEILISMTLMVIIGLGTAYILARANVSQRDMNIHLLTVNKMRSILQEGNSSCVTDATISINGTTVATPCTYPVTAPAYTVSAISGSSTDTGNVQVSSPEITVSVSSQTSTMLPAAITIKP